MSKILKLEVKNFRNLSDDIVDFSPKINCIFGQNGNGKTNLLEAIFFLFYKKSFRKSATFGDLVSIDTENPTIRLSALIEELDGEKRSLSLKIDPKEAIWSINGQISKRGLNLKSVVVNPFDAFNFFNEAAFRRYFVDFYLSQLDSTYKTDLSKYQKLIKFKNRLLSSKPDQFREQLSAINHELAPLCYNLVGKRAGFAKELNKHLETIFNRVFSESYSLKFELVSSFLDKGEKEIGEKFEEHRVKDEMIGHTTVGIHRDDYQILVNGLSAFDYASLGQQKMSYLGLLFAYIELFWYKFSVYPIILIDDISGELDEERWGRLVSYLEASKFQVLITTANHHFKEKLESIKGIKKIELRAGKIINL